MIDTSEYFNGGNLLADLDGNCFAENANDVAYLNDDPKSFFAVNFGCATTTLLPQAAGIGDIDERVKFLSGKDVLTDDATYALQLQSAGYTVTMIPTTGVKHETYMNTLYVNGTIFVPQMGLSSDSKAIAAYQNLPMHPTVVGVSTKKLADKGFGNIHCVTMNYPPGTFTGSPLGANFVKFK